MGEAQLISTSAQSPPAATRPFAAPPDQHTGSAPAAGLDVSYVSEGDLDPAPLRLPEPLPSLPQQPSDAPIPATPEQLHLGKRSFGQWLNRPRRVLLTLAAVWVVAVFDLGFTLAEAETLNFVELNPIAAGLLSGPSYAVTAYKFGLLSVGTVILLGLRRHAIAELGCWFLLAAKVYVALRWFSYFDCLVGGYTNPLIEIPLDATLGP